MDLSKFTLPARLATVFIMAFAANLVWENLHANLYVAYQGGAITEFILLRATLVDAAIITAMAAIFWRFEFLNKRLWLAFVTGIIISTGIELWALSTGRWSYNELMPLIPLLNIGLTPTIQLGLIAYGIFKIPGLMKQQS